MRGLAAVAVDAQRDEVGGVVSAALTPRNDVMEDVPVAVELRGGGPVSELSQAGVAATSGAAVVVNV